MPSLQYSGSKTIFVTFVASPLCLGTPKDEVKSFCACAIIFSSGKIILSMLLFYTKESRLSTVRKRSIKSVEFFAPICCKSVENMIE